MGYVARPAHIYHDVYRSDLKWGYAKSASGVSFRSDYNDLLVPLADRNHWSRLTTRQARRAYYSQPLPYTRHKAFVSYTRKGQEETPSNTTAGYHVSPFTHRDWRDEVVNVARARFIERVRQSCAMGEFFGEIGKTVSAIERPLRAVTDGFRALLAARQGNVNPLYHLLLRHNRTVRDPHRGHTVWRESGRWARRTAFMEKLRRRRNLVKDSDALLANAWLELQYGLGAAVQEVYNFAEVLDAGFSVGRVVGRAKKRFVDVKEPSGLYGNFSTAIVDVRAHVQATVRLRTSTVGTLEQFGVLNPASLAWELTPFSFVVDWFVNIGSFLRQFGETAGLDFEHAFVSVKKSGTGQFTVREAPPWGETHSSQSFSVSLERTLGFPRVALTWQKGLTFKRAINSVALIASIGHSVLNHRPPRGWT